MRIPTVIEQQTIESDPIKLILENQLAIMETLRWQFSTPREMKMKLDARIKATKITLGGTH